jgi:hypothetical protein
MPYRHFTDRRQEPRRTDEIGLRDPFFSGDNRRLYHDRRETGLKRRS